MGFSGACSCQNVARNLFDDKLVEWLVGVQSSHYIVPVGLCHVDSVYGGHLGFSLDVAADVEPVTAPAFPVVGGAQ